MISRQSDCDYAIIIDHNVLRASLGMLKNQPIRYGELILKLLMLLDHWKQPVLDGVRIMQYVHAHKYYIVYTVLIHNKYIISLINETAGWYVLWKIWKDLERSCGWSLIGSQLLVVARLYNFSPSCNGLLFPTMAQLMDNWCICGISG